MARAKAVLRRSGLATAGGVLRVGDLSIDLDGYQASFGAGAEAKPLALTPHRVPHPRPHVRETRQRCSPRSELVDACLPGSDALDRTVDSHLSKLRKKLELVARTVFCRACAASATGCRGDACGRAPPQPPDPSRHVGHHNPAGILVFFGSYVAYSVIIAVYNPPDTDEWFTSLDLAIFAALILIALPIAAVVALRLARRILDPLESLAARRARSPRAIFRPGRRRARARLAKPLPRRRLQTRCPAAAGHGGRHGAVERDDRP